MSDPMTTYFTTRSAYHRGGCPALKRAKLKGEWRWANDQPDFDPIEFGRNALKNIALKRPCFVCFPEVLKP